MIKNLFVVLLLVSSVLTVGCAKTDDKPAQQEDPIYGTWTYTNPSDSSKAMAAVVNQDGTITLVSFKIVSINSSANSGSMYFRRNSGKFTRNGDMFTAVYDYETCNPVKTEKFSAKIDASGKLLVANEDNSIVFNMTKSTSDSSASITMIEDKDCNKF